MSGHEIAVRVYYEDTDLAGVVYYANYLKFFERGRTEWLRAAGIEQGRLRAETGLVFLVTRIVVDYRRPARFDDLLRVTTRIESVGAASVAMAQAVLRDGDRLAEAAVRLACVDAEGQPARLPAALRAVLR